MTTLSDEEFQRLNDQLCGLKLENHNLTTHASKLTSELNALKLENNQLRKQLTSNEHGGRSETGHSIKQKLNPFALAKNLAQKVDTRLNHNHLNNEHEEAKMPSSNFAHRLENQELDFLKTNETLKAEIAFLQNKISVLESENQILSNQDSVKSTELDLSNSKRNISLIAKCIDLDEDDNFALNVRQWLASQTSVKTANVPIESQIKTILQFFEIENGKIEIEAATTVEEACNVLRKHYSCQYVAAKELADSLIVQVKTLLERIRSLKLEVRNEKSQMILLQEELVRVKQDLENDKSNTETIIQSADDKVRHTEDQLLASESQLDQLRKEMETLQAKLIECQNDRRISEKRGFMIIKELKKQLNVEKNRADKFQSLIKTENELIDGDKVTPFDAATVRSNQSDKCSSSGSWGYMNEPTCVTPQSAKNESEYTDLEMFEMGAVIGADSQDTSSTKTQTTVNLEQENSQLLSKVSTLQQDNWRLEEHANQLERELRCLREELAAKSQMVQLYSKESLRSSERHSPTERTRSNRLPSSPTAAINNSLLKVIGFLREKSELVGGDDGRQINECNRQLQRMVEEILTKNMHLQASLEEMSNELMKAKNQLQHYQQPLSH